VYFGDIGSNSQVLLEYFESHGARKCLPKENPAEYMLEVVNQRTNDQGEDWHSIWKSSKERQLVDSEIGRIHAEAQRDNIMAKDTIEAQGEFATPLTTQIKYVTYRIFQQYWRMPSYIFSKLVLGGAAGLFVGFTFYNADDSLAGMQNVLFCIFMLTTLFTTLVQQVTFPRLSCFQLY
jgi:ATP-binding cassette subfamily G (WHITE) protein 2 (PDR)